MSETESHWYVYILKCADETFYTGITTDIERRTKEHNQLSSGAKYTRARRPVVPVYSEKLESRQAAAKREYEIKHLSRSEKCELITFSNK